MLPKVDNFLRLLLTVSKGGDELHSVAKFAKLESAQMISVISKEMKYFTKKGGWFMYCNLLK